MQRIAFGLLLCAFGAGCRRPVEIASSPVPLPGAWSHCWWTVMRSTLPVDSVASDFRRAFVTLGQPNIHWAKIGDTVFVRSGPSPLFPSDEPRDTTSYGESYWARAVAFARGDTTNFRLYVAIVPPARGWLHPADSVRVNRTIPVCAEIRRAGDPGEDEKMPVWSRVP